jgi:hypothetical protein
MTRNEALEVAKANLSAHAKANIHFTFKVWVHMTDLVAREQAQKEIDDRFGYLHGWFKVGEFCFSREELTGEKYDITQGGWAFI